MFNSMMMMAAAGSNGAPPEKKTFNAGTLKYTWAGLIFVSFWLLWGGFIYTLFDQSLPRIMPLKLKELGASDTMIAMLNNTLSYIIVFIFAPIVGFKSDRFRSKWGRRRPFLLWSTPFVGLFMILIGSYAQVGNLFLGGHEQVSVLGRVVSQGSFILMLFAALLIGFQFSNIFCNVLFTYLFNDVIPPQFLARIQAFSSAASMGATMIYHKVLFPHVLENFRLIFTIAGIAYVSGFLLMCFFVKEGQYPPPPPNIGNKTGRWASAKTFFVESFSHKYYWYLFLMYVFQFSAGRAQGNFDLLRNTKSLGLTMGEIGNVNFYMAMITSIMVLPVGWIADKFHPLRVYVVAGIIMVLNSVLQCVWIFKDFGHHGNLVLYAVFTIGFVPFNACWEGSEVAMLMRVLPREKFGQFCSANAMVRAIALIFTSFLVGVFMDTLKNVFHMGDERYRYYQLWMVVFLLPMIFCLVQLYRGWKKRGGLHNYIPPGSVLEAEAKAAAAAAIQGNCTGS